MKQGPPLYSKDGYRTQAVFEDASDASCVGYQILTGMGAILRVEPAFDDARRWLDQLIDSSTRRAGHLRRDGTPQVHR